MNSSRHRIAATGGTKVSLELRVLPRFQLSAGALTLVVHEPRGVPTTAAS